jgi:S-adenosylmethionine-diacylglycerol 3-amino-3-carboxypropyl transferase
MTVEDVEVAEVAETEKPAAETQRRGASLLRGKAARPSCVLRRTRLPSARTDKLYFAQVREDPLLEIEALEPRDDRTFVVVGSGGCTALSLLARGAGKVVAVDLNTTQNHLVQLKAAALHSVDRENLIAFLGAGEMNPAVRLANYGRLRWSLGGAATAYWDANQSMIARGVLNAGMSERFIRLVARVVRRVVHPESRIDRLLACRSLEDQRELYHDEWNNRRWRMLFTVLLNQRMFHRAYDPLFFENVSNPSFSAHFRKLLEHALCEIPVATNYFLHHMLRGKYPVGIDGGLPPYLEPAPFTWTGDLELVDGGFAEFLATCEDDSVDGFALSNICEWLDDGQITELFSQVERVAKPGARLCFRNFVGHTEVPPAFRSSIQEDRDAGIAAISRDRSCLQSRIAICRVEK